MDETAVTDPELGDGVIYRSFLSLHNTTNTPHLVKQALQNLINAVAARCEMYSLGTATHQEEASEFLTHLLLCFDVDVSQGHYVGHPFLHQTRDQSVTQRPAAYYTALFEQHTVQRLPLTAAFKFGVFNVVTGSPDSRCSLYNVYLEDRSTLFVPLCVHLASVITGAVSLEACLSNVNTTVQATSIDCDSCTVVCHCKASQLSLLNDIHPDWLTCCTGNANTYQARLSNAGLHHRLT